MLTVAIAQAAPAVLDLPASVDRACAWIARAGHAGARLLAFAETWITTYPFWCDTGTLGKWNHGPSKKLHARLLRSSLRVPSPETKRLGDAARRAKCAVVIGVNERAGGSIYNSLLFFTAKGELAGRHRKLVPTFGERLVWGHGDATGLRAYDLGPATVTGLVCWEHWMPLPRHILHATDEQVHVASWPACREPYLVAARHYAFEGRVFVLSAAMVLRKSDLPRDFELAADVKKIPDPILDGGSAIIAPDASIVAGPVNGREALLVADLDLARVDEEKLTLDVAGHYARPDLFEVRVRK
jgi:predicted amidohydrolase